MSFYEFVKKSPRFSSDSDLKDSDSDQTHDTYDMYDDFWSSCIGSYMMFTRSDIKPNTPNSKRLRTQRRFSLGLKTHETHVKKNEQAEPKNISELYMKIVLAARSPDNVCFMVRVYNTDGENIVDKWVIQKRAEVIIDNWMLNFPQTTIMIEKNENDQTKDYTNLEDMNADSDSISPRSPREKKSYPNHPKEKYRTSSHIVRKTRVTFLNKSSRSRSYTDGGVSGGIKRSPTTIKFI